MEAGFLAPAAAYDRFVGRYGAALARALAGHAGVAAGMRALDVGSGPGALTAELVARLGAGSVVAVEPSPVFAEACAARNPGVEVRRAEAEELPFGDGSFDAALAQLVVNFIGDPPAGVREMARVTRPGGIVAAAVWDYSGAMTMLRTFWEAATALAPDAADERRVMRYCTPGELEGLWAGAGLADVAVEGTVVEASYRDFDDLWSPLEAGVGPAGQHVVALDPAARADLRDDYRRRLGAGDEPFTLSARAWLVRGATS